MNWVFYCFINLFICNLTLKILYITLYINLHKLCKVRLCHWIHMCASKGSIFSKIEVVALLKVTLGPFKTCLHEVYKIPTNTKMGNLVKRHVYWACIFNNTTFCSLLERDNHFRTNFDVIHSLYWSSFQTLFGPFMFRQKMAILKPKNEKTYLSRPLNLIT